MNDRTLLRVCGICFCLLAVSNMTKFLEMSSNQGFMFFGMRQHGTPDLVWGWVFGLVYTIVAIAFSSGAVYLLRKHRDELT